MNLEKLLYTADHEWVSIEGDTLTLGITDFAQHAIGDIVYFDLPKLGTQIEKGGVAAVVESVKATSDIFSPVSGTVSAVNEALVDDPALVNEAAFENWIVKLTVSGSLDPKELALMDADAYQTHCEKEG